METLADNQDIDGRAFSEEFSDFTLTKCPVTLTNLIIGGKWKPVIIYNISRGIRRFGEMQRAIPGVSKKMLTQELRDLERNGILNRKIYAEIPPRVEYSLTERGESALPVLEAMVLWGQEVARSFGIK
ncbi:winged helix-turn-helix transcriptional regulator [Larkinella sp. VNQ87]|uniref:winged helix-turn-helix transcriptional regulator n=1 Tax=Larkinella sp. VNQ87 TaxID=3400921 RepID=UPI003C02BA2C